jgi:hypothetical protein
MAKSQEGITWQSVLLDYNLATPEYTGMDVDRTSALVDLGRECSGVVIYVPTIDSAAISLLAQMDSAITTVPADLHYKKPADGSTAAWASTAGTGGYFIHIDCLGAVRYFRIYTSQNQTADRTFYVLGTV